MEIIQSNRLIWKSLTLIFQPSSNEMLSAFSSKTSLLIQNNYNYCHKDSRMSCTFSREICIGNRDMDSSVRPFAKGAVPFWEWTFLFWNQSFIIQTIGWQLSYEYPEQHALKILWKTVYWTKKYLSTNSKIASVIL